MTADASLTHTRASPIFTLSAVVNTTASVVAPDVALVQSTVSLTVTARAVVYTSVRCPCGRLIMAIPGTVVAEPRIVANNNARSGRGRVVECRRCQSLVEIIEHR